MSTPPLPAEGGCRCGQVRFRISAPPLLTAACHCRGCQRMTASAFSLSVGVPTAGFTIIAGEPVIGGIHGETRHYHCAHCKSWLYTEPPGTDAFVNVRATMLDQPGDLAVPFVEFNTAEKLAWATTPARHSFATVPAMDAYQGLIAEYRASVFTS